MSGFVKAIDTALNGLDRLRRENDYPPRASRAILARLCRAEMAPNELWAIDKPARLALIGERVTICRLCPHLASSRTQTVFGVGNPTPS